MTSSNHIWDIKSFEKSIIFLDEFDSQKNYFLKSIIDKSIRSNIDLIELFRLMAETFKNMSYGNKFKYDLERFSPIKKEFEKIYDERSLKYVIDTNLLESEFDNLPILIDSSFRTFNLQSKSNKLFLEVDEIKEQLSIINNEVEGSFKLAELLKDVSQVIHRYILFCRNDIYQKIKFFQEQNNKDKVQINLEKYINAKIHDNIKIFGLSSTDIKYKYLTNLIKNDLFLRSSFQKLLGKRKWNLYKNGFSLININKSYIDSSIAEVEYFDLITSPEELLVKASNQCMLVGVSATANMNTVIKNFDIEYLKSNTNFSQPSTDEILKMQELYLDSKNQRNRKFHIETINDDTPKSLKLREFCERSFGSDYNLLNYLQEQRIDTFYLNQYMNFIDCYRRYLEEDKIHSFIYFSNRYIQNENSSNNFNYPILIYLLVSLIKYIEPKNDFIINLKTEVKKYGNDIKSLISNNVLFFQYDKYTENLYDDYVKNSIDKKMFVYANYQRIGTGKNLEYSIQDVEKKDFDAIFLEKPTKLIQRNPETLEDKFIGIFQLESLIRNGVISRTEYAYELKQLFSNSKNYSKCYSQTNDNLDASMQVIIQAIGRLHRTDSYSDMYLFIDNALIEIISKFRNENIPLLPSTIKLLEKYYSVDTELSDRNKKEFENKLNELTLEFDNLIQYSIKVFKNPTNPKNLEDMELIWDEMRDFLTANPTVSSIHDLELGKYLQYNEISHIEVDDYKYTCYQANDFNDISLIKKDNYYEVEISEESANLHLIRNCPELNEFARNNSIATSFKYKNLLIPIAFNNIYKGALGEKIGKYIIEKYCGIKLDDLAGTFEEKYESFDYKNEKYGVYFDFKYYSQNTLLYTRSEIVRNTLYKLQVNKLKKAFIVNIFAQVEETPSIVQNDNVIFIPYLVNSINPNKPFIDNNMIDTIKGVLLGN